MAADWPLSGHPLRGVRVVELTHVAAGPFAGMLLADLGADVVKLEPPTGDQMRSWPPIAEDTETGEQFSHNFASVNRNKRSVVVDLKDTGDTGGLARARALVAEADVVVENYRPGVLDRLGLGYDEVTRDRDRGLVYCSVSGYGLTSPYVNDGAYDVVIQGMSGVMSVTGERLGGPVKAGVPFGDFTAGLYAALTIASLLPSVREGRQVRIDCPMLDCLIATSALQTSEYWGTGEEPGRLGTAHPRNAPYQAFRAKNGDFTVAAGNDRLWAAVAEVAGLPELVDDPRFRTQRDRVANQTVLAGILQAKFGGRRTSHWLRELRARGVPCGPVNTYGQMLADDHVTATGLVQEQKVPVAGLTPTVVYPARIGGVPSRLDRAAPVLGADTDEVLAGCRLGRRVTTFVLELDRPDRANALSADLVERLHAGLDRAIAERAGVLVLRGRGRHFCGGFDLDGLDDEDDAGLAHRFLRIGLLLERLLEAPFTTVAVVQGSAVGAGADLVAACDHRIGTPDARLRFPGAAFGVVLGTRRLAGLVGGERALALAAGESLTGTEAHWAGLLTASVPAARLEDELERTLARSVHPAAARGVLRATRAVSGGYDADAALADLARSLAVPGLHSRIVRYAHPTRIRSTA